jgi:hypothetical protein
MQGGRCFYCAGKLPARPQIDHFIPWSRRADNSIENLVATHAECNGRKSDYLAAAEHVERWSARARERAGDLARIAHEERWETQPALTLSAARAIYGILPDDTPTWKRGREFVVLDKSRVMAALAA